MRLVLEAYDCGDSDEVLRQWWGDDPPYWLVLGLRYFRAVRSRVEAESYRLAREDKKKGVGAAPKGFDRVREPETF